MRKILIHIMLLMVTVAVSSCVYPFEPELDKSAGRNLVIEGDLLIGSFSYIRLSYMSYLDEDLAEWDVKAEVRAEDEKGNMYNGKKVDSNLYLISLNLADPSSRFRLYVVLDDGREYASEWAEARRAPVVDEITHELDATTNQVRFNITLHSDDGEQYFRWFFDEDWEYESLYDAKYWYSIDTSDPDDNGTMIKYGPREGTHYCWMNQQSTGLYFTTTRDLESNKVQEKNFYRVAAQTQRMSSLYSMNVRVESTTEDCYDYWKNVRTNSENLGDLFSPIPSEMRGNIYNLSDPDETVLGFVNVSTVAEKRVFVDNKKTGYYIKKTYIPEDDWMIEVPTNEWRRYYIYKQYLPVSKGEGSIFYWAPKRCVDCRLQGGTKNRPVFWPNDHY